MPHKVENRGANALRTQVFKDDLLILPSDLDDMIGRPRPLPPRSGLAFQHEWPAIVNFQSTFAQIARENGLEFPDNPDEHVLLYVREALENFLSSVPGTPCPPRRWLTRSANVAPDADGHARLGGIVLVKAEHWARHSRGGNVGWEHVDGLRVMGDATRERRQEVKERIFKLFRAILQAQPTRRYVLGTTLLGEEMTSFVADRQSLDETGTCDVTVMPECILGIVVGMSFMKDEDLGCGIEKPLP